MRSTCRFCGHEKEGESFQKWVKPTFTDLDKLVPGSIVCYDCLFWFEEKSSELAEKMGKDKPQRMRNYSHFVIDGEWVPLSKGDKPKMKELLLGDSFPELAAIAESGQKHIVFRATRNEPGSKAGWVQFEEQSLWIEPDDLGQLLDVIEPALSVFSKGEIQTGQYLPYRIMDYGIKEWQALESVAKPNRGTLLFNLAIFLAQKEIDDAGNGSGSTRGSVEGSAERLQEPVPPGDMGTVREHDSGGGVHEQSREVRQLGLFET